MESPLSFNSSENFFCQVKSVLILSIISVTQGPVKFSYVLSHHVNLINLVININKEEALCLHPNLLFFYNAQTDVNISDLKLKQHLITNKKKYKYEHIPVDFNPKDYIELNKDLQHMTEIEAKTHYEYHGYKEKRKYVKV